jgi:NitT/TauT family transport system substrate-binding protein
MTRLRCLAKTAQLAVFVALSVFSTLAGAADKITFVTDYGLYGRHAYYFVAMEKGYYARENLDIEIVRSQGSANTIKQVANGTAQVGFADAFAVVLGRANDDIPVKLVAMIYPKPPHAVYVLKESGIARPKDFEGKTLADTAFSSVPKLFATYAKAAGIDAGKVKWIAVNSDALPGMLTTRRVDGIGQFTVGEPLLAAAAAPKEVLGFLYSDAGLDYQQRDYCFGYYDRDESWARSALRRSDVGRPEKRDGRPEGSRRNYAQVPSRDRRRYRHR